LLHCVIASDPHPALTICVTSARRNGFDTRIWGLGNSSKSVWQILREELLNLNPEQMILFTDYIQCICQRDVFDIEEWIRANKRSVLMSTTDLKTPNGICIGGRVRDIVDCIIDPYDIQPRDYFKRRYLHDLKTAHDSMIQLDTEGIYFASVHNYNKKLIYNQNYIFLNSIAPNVLMYDSLFSCTNYWKHVLYVVLDTKDIRYLCLDALSLRILKTKIKYIFYHALCIYLIILYLC
jgi:hypothetical protein